MKKLTNFLAFIAFSAFFCLQSCQKETVAPAPTPTPTAVQNGKIKVSFNVPNANPAFILSNWNMKVGIGEVTSSYYSQQLTTTSDNIYFYEVKPGSYDVICNGTVKYGGTVYTAKGSGVVQVKSGATAYITINVQ